MKNSFVFGGNDYITKPVFKDELIARILFHQALAKSRKELQQSELKFRQIFESAVEGIFQTDHKGIITDINPSMAAIFAYDSISEMLSSKIHLQDLLSEDGDVQQVAEFLSGASLTLNFDAWFDRKSGRQSGDLLL